MLMLMLAHLIQTIKKIKIKINKAPMKIVIILPQLKIQRIALMRISRQVAELLRLLLPQIHQMIQTALRTLNFPNLITTNLMISVIHPPNQRILLPIFQLTHLPKVILLQTHLMNLRLEQLKM